MKSRAKKTAINVLRVLICVAALWLVIRGVTYYDHVHLADGGQVIGDVIAAADAVQVRQADGQIVSIPAERIARDEDDALRVSYGLRTAWRNSRKTLLLLALLVHFPVVFPQALRFQWLLGAQRISLSYWECVKLSFAGNFLNFATPLGSHAGDAFKAYFASLHTRQKTEAVTTVVLDRIIGLSTLLLVAGLITLLASSQGKLAILQPYVLGLLAVAIVGMIVYFSPFVRDRLAWDAWIARVPALAHLRRIDQAARTLAGRGFLLGSAMALTAFLQFLALAAYFVVAVAMNMQAHAGNVLEYFAYFYTGTLVQALPGPPQGLGTVELAYRYFFDAYGTPSQIVCMALIIRLVVLVCALPGLVVTLTGGYRPKQLLQPSADNEAITTTAVHEPVI
jgi:hypothetical protein